MQGRIAKCVFACPFGSCNWSFTAARRWKFWSIFRHIQNMLWSVFEL